MDWAAIGGIAAVTAVIIAWLQFRHSKSPASRPPEPSQVVIGTPSPSPPPLIDYEIREGTGRYPFEPDWKAPISDDRWQIHQDMGHRLERIIFATILIKNPNDFTVGPIELELSVRDVWSTALEFSSSLARSAVRLDMAHDHLRISIAEMPADERILVSLLSGGMVGSQVASGNAAVKLRRIWMGND